MHSQPKNIIIISVYPRKADFHVNIIKTKINKESVIVEFAPNEQVGFHDKEGKYIDHYNGNQILDFYNEMTEKNKVIDFPSSEVSMQDVPILEKEAA